MHDWETFAEDDPQISSVLPWTPRSNVMRMLEIAEKRGKNYRKLYTKGLNLSGLNNSLFKGVSPFKPAQKLSGGVT